MLKRILLNICMITTLCTSAVTLTGCDAIKEVELPAINLNTSEPEVLANDKTIVFMFSQVNRKDISVIESQIETIRNEYGFISETIVLDDDEKITSSLRKVLENNADLVVGYGQGMAIVFDLFQDTYPDTKFVVIDGVSQDEDIKSISFDTDAIAYSLGVMVATAFNGSNDFGYIGDFENDNNEQYKVGFIKGLQSINKNASIDIDYINGTNGEQAAYELTKQYQSLGVKFVMNATNPTITQGVYRACLELAEEGQFIYTNAFFGDDTNESNPYILSGIIKDYEYATQLAVNEFVKGQLNSTNIELPAGHDAFQLLDVTSQVANYTNREILNDNAIKAGRKALEDIKNKNIIL